MGSEINEEIVHIIPQHGRGTSTSTLSRMGHAREGGQGGFTFVMVTGLKAWVPRVSVLSHAGVAFKDTIPAPRQCVRISLASLPSAAIFNAFQRGRRDLTQKD